MKKILFSLILLLAIFLRSFQFGQNPPSLYWDEASLGYNAYTIASSLLDEHGERLPFSRFIAFGDYKPPGYVYAAAMGIKLFGLSETAVRLPSMLAGIGMVVFTYLLVKELAGKGKIALLSAFFVAISPWSIHFSRAAFEAHLAALFNLMGVYLFFLSKRRKWAIVPCVIFFILSFYTFNANRIIAPLLLIALSMLEIGSVKNNLKWVVISIIIGLLMLVPSVSFLQSPESKLRLQEVSILNNLKPLLESNQRIALDGNAWWSKIINNRRVVYSLDYLKHYFDNFSGRFLFTHGDVNPRLNMQGMGQLYAWDLPLIVFGLLFLLKENRKLALILLVWMCIVPIPAGLAKETPHALRIISILPTYQIIAAYGLYKIAVLANKKRKIWSLLFVICLLFSASLYYFLHMYYVHFPKNWSGEWQYGYKEMVTYVLENENKYNEVFVTRALGRPYIYFAFYKPYTVDEFLALKTETRDIFGFYDVKNLGKISFEDMKPSDIAGKVLYVGTRGDTPSGFMPVKTIKNLAGDDVFVISQRL